MPSSITDNKPAVTPLAHDKGLYLFSSCIVRDSAKVVYFISLIYKHTFPILQVIIYRMSEG